jgi:hypothetical protein
MAFDDPAAGDGTLTASEYDNLVDATLTPVAVGQFVVSTTGSQSVTGVGFQPSSVKFQIHANGGQNISTSGGSGSVIANSASQMTGIARDDGTRQAIGNAASGSSINQIRRFSSNSKAILLEYAAQSGDNIGTLDADVTGFDADGFTVNINSAPQTEVVIYTAYR